MASRSVIKTEIDWPCRVEYLYADHNQGCLLGVSRAITWFFQHVEEGIIIEDDCVPHSDFFMFCSELLERYRLDERVWCISGSNFQDGQWRGDGSYYFSRYNHCWGWASWRRCWAHYDPLIQIWPKLQASDLLCTIFEDQLERSYWQGIWDSLHYKNFPDTWDYQWTFTCLVNGGLTALPNRNLVSNIGFGPDATHTVSTKDANLADQGLENLVHPSFILRDVSADKYTFDHVFGGESMRQSQSLLPRAKRRLGSLLRRLKASVRRRCYLE